MNYMMGSIIACRHVILRVVFVRVTSGGVIIQICSGGEINIPAWDGQSKCSGGMTKISKGKVKINDG